MAGGIICRPLASAVAAFDSPRSAEPAIEVQLFQTAASLENLAISTYAAALELPFVQENATVVHFIETTMQQHTEHLALFNAQTEDLGGAAAGGAAPEVLPNCRCVVADVGGRGRCSRVGGDA